MNYRHFRHPLRAALALVAASLYLLAAGGFHLAQAQNINQDRLRGRAMLQAIKSDIQKDYYDPTFHGIDLDKSFAEADERVKAAKNAGEMLAIIGQLLMSFNDSHLFFRPPRVVASVQHGWEMEMIGDKGYIIAVQPGSDAEAKGLRPGDRVLTIEGYRFTRADLWKIEYVLYLLSPRPQINLTVERNGQVRQLTVAAKVRSGKLITDLEAGMASDRYSLIREWETERDLNAHRIRELGNDCVIWKMPAFSIGISDLEDLMGKVRKRKALILDLRGNGGGSEETLLRLLGYFFDHDVKVGEARTRKNSKPLIAKSHGDHVFDGKLAVLVDSRSGSAAEVFARVIQLEKRGVVIGDKTAGAVMRAQDFDHEFGADLVIGYGASVTVADLTMADGKSLEHVGVTPDELLLPTALDLANERDPVMARAAELVGLKIAPELAGKMFPVQWRRN
jgi:carboxyl-terminal processing protease